MLTHADTPFVPSRPRVPLLRGLWQSAWLQPRRLLIALVVLLSCAPAVYMLERTDEARRNIAYWDEFDTALALVLKLKGGTTPGEFLEQLFAVNNEHRMVTSRLMFATSYWLTGTLDFSTISLIGNASIVALCVMLVVTAGTTVRRVRLAAVLAALIFQLEHYENFLWSGSSIDHFQVVLLAGGAILGLARGTRGGLAVGAACAFFANFTLAHGIVVWPVGALMLWHQGNRRALLVWCGLAAAAVAAFLSGFQFNQAQSFAALSPSGALSVARYWLTMLGAVPALGYGAVAPWLGALLLLVFALLLRRSAIAREPILVPLALFAIGAMGLIALGRAAESKGLVFSRYYVLSAVAWSVVLFLALERLSSPRRPLRLLGCSLPLLVAFNVTANARFADAADTWLECRNRAVLWFKQHGVDGRGPFHLHPTPARSTALLHEAERLGVYRMGSVCLPRSFPDARPSTRITYHIDDLMVSERSAAVAGWAAIPEQVSERGRVHVVLRSAGAMHVYSTVSVTRPDVANATRQPGWVLSGFRFARRRDSLPTGEYQLGLLIDNGEGGEYVMTAHRLRLIGEGQALLATGD